MRTALGLDGKTYKFAPASNRMNTDKSSLHNEVIQIIKEEFPTIRPLEDVSARINRWVNLYIDIFIPICRVAIEVHGKQHFEEIGFFHKNRQDFFKSNRRDQQKKEWCELNEIVLVELRYDEDREEWRQKIKVAIKN